MSSFPVIDYQQQLIVASLDDFTPNAALPNCFGGQFGENPSAWKQAVLDFLCINLKCGLLEVVHRPDISKCRDTQALRAILTQGDITSGLPLDVIWDALYFNGTERLNAMLEGLNMRTWDAISLDPDSRLLAQLVSLYECDAME